MVPLVGLCHSILRCACPPVGKVIHVWNCLSCGRAGNRRPARAPLLAAGPIPTSPGTGAADRHECPAGAGQRSQQGEQEGTPYQRDQTFQTPTVSWPGSECGQVCGSGPRPKPCRPSFHYVGMGAHHPPSPAASTAVQLWAPALGVRAGIPPGKPAVWPQAGGP